MKFLKSIHKFIPGFRKLSANSMIIAVTYYGAAAVIALKYWQWGLALLALPFLVFNLLELNREKNRRLSLVAAAVAGLLVLLGAAVGVSVGSVPPAAATPLNSVPPGASAAVSAPAPRPQSAALAQNAYVAANSRVQEQYAYVAAKEGKTFHLPGCGSAKRIKPENQTGFKARDDAIAAGLSPCKVCKP